MTWVFTPEYKKRRRMIIGEAQKKESEAAAGFCGLKTFQA